jgi:hypothetical protein
MNKEQFCAISLPHKLKCKRTFFDEEELGKENGICEIDGFDYHIYKEGGIFDLTPICHHLSDLTKDEWIERLNTFACKLLDAAHVYDEKNIIGLNWMTQPFEIVMWLVKNRFNLMDESEPFIDVNTLPENPYK